MVLALQQTTTITTTTLIFGKTYADLHNSLSWKAIGELYDKSPHTCRVQAYKWRKASQRGPDGLEASVFDGSMQFGGIAWQYPTVRFADNPKELTASHLEQIPIPTPRIEAAVAPLTVNENNVLILGDLHAPYHNAEMLRRAIYVTRTHYPEVKSVIVGGDIFDFSSISQHPHTSPEPNVSDTLIKGAEVLRGLLRYFDHCYICNGNHDERLSKKLDNVWGMDLLLNAAFGKDWPACDVRVTNLDYLYVGAGWLVGHPSNYSGQGGKTPSELAELHQRNVVCFHNHHVGMSQSKSGKFIGIDSGHMTMPDLHYYRSRRLSKFTAWTAGFTILKNGYAHLYTGPFTDWKALGC